MVDSELSLQNDVATYLCWPHHLLCWTRCFLLHLCLASSPHSLLLEIEENIQLSRVRRILTSYYVCLRCVRHRYTYALTDRWHTSTWRSIPQPLTRTTCHSSHLVVISDRTDGRAAVPSVRRQCGISLRAVHLDSTRDLVFFIFPNVWLLQ